MKLPWHLCQGERFHHSHGALALVKIILRNKIIGKHHIGINPGLMGTYCYPDINVRANSLTNNFYKIMGKY